MSVVQQIVSKLEKIPIGTPFTSREFLELGSQTNVGKILERLTNSGEIRRIRQGMYVCPKINPHVGEVTPSIHEVVKLITASTGEIIQVQGAEAARLFGLSTQVPMKQTFFTSGRSRKMTIGNQEVEFKHTSPKKLFLAGTKVGLAITALWYLGKEKVTTETIEKIVAKLSMEECNQFYNSKLHMPAWMAKMLIFFNQQKK